MPHETRVNLKRLLEDIRDSYPSPLEEVIITELIANALDSGATEIRFALDPEEGVFSCKDNGRGMTREALREYHNIAASTKERGRGIGFAGVGAKLALLISESVITETRGPRGSRAATQWYLSSQTRAPWKFIPCSGRVSASRGTAVVLTLAGQRQSFRTPSFAKETIQKHFAPLLDVELRDQFMRFVYPKPISFFVNDELVCAPALEPDIKKHIFKIWLGARNRRPIGIGMLMQKFSQDSDIQQSGIAISTYGKVIKCGWEWTGIIPKEYASLSGLVEIPALAEILITNKSDFLSDQTSLKKYYRYRKAVQEALLQALPLYGEFTGIEERGKSSKEVRELSREIEYTLEQLSESFPELLSFVGIRKKRVEVPAELGILSSSEGEGEAHERERGVGDTELIGDTSQTESEAVDLSGDKAERQSAEQTAAEETLGLIFSEDGILRRRISKKRPGLKIFFQEFENDGATSVLGRLVEDTVVVNTAHPAWKKAKDARLDEYHILTTVALVLSEFLQPERSVQEFVSAFFARWGQPEKGKQGSLL